MKKQITNLLNTRLGMTLGVLLFWFVGAGVFAASFVVAIGLMVATIIVLIIINLITRLRKRL